MSRLIAALEILYEYHPEYVIIRNHLLMPILTVSVRGFTWGQGNREMRTKIRDGISKKNALKAAFQLFVTCDGPLYQEK